jgi:dipeptidyl aminopeptidase/acylaminoacyl peptidase
MNTEEYLDHLLTLPKIARPLVSRDRKWVAWTWYRKGPAADVFLAPTDGSSPPERLSDTLENTYIVSWVPDSSAVIVMEDKGGNERYQLFRIDLGNPLVMHPLTDEDPDFYVRGGELHANNDFLIYGANYDFSSNCEIDPTWIYRHNLRTGDRKVLAKPEKGGYIIPRLSSDGSLIVYSRKDCHPAGRQIWLVDIDGCDDREILNFGEDVKAFATWLPGEHKLLVIAEAETHRKLGVYSVEDEKMEWLVDDPERNIENAYAPYGSKEIVILEAQNARLKPVLFDPSSGEERELSVETGNLIPLAPYTSDEWIGFYYSSSQPDDLGRFSTVAPEIELLASISRVWDQTLLSQDDFVQAESYQWRSVDGLGIQGYLYRPCDEPKGAIVYVHGGPTAHSQDRINNQIQVFARNGYVVLDPNYRGSTGFGITFQEAIKEDGWGGREQEDIRAGIEQLITDGIAVAGKVGITGTSYGGYSAWWAITHFPKEITAAAAPICGMTDLVVDYESTRPDLRPLSEEMIGGRPDEIPEKYHERSPINFISNIQGDLLIVQGGRDPNVTPENVRVVRESLDREGKSYELLKFEDEGHGISKPKNQRVLYLALLSFFDRVLAIK